MSTEDTSKTFDQDIWQTRTSKSLRKFQESFRSTFGLTQYRNREDPAIFFGCYTDEDMRAILSHKGTKYIIWAGSDSDIRKNPLARRFIRTLKAVSNIHHLAISDFIEKDLRLSLISCRRITLCFTNFDMFTPVKKGKNIYVYIGNLKCAEFYGCNILASLMPRMKNKNYRFVLTVSSVVNPNTAHSRNMLAKYPFLRYAKCVKKKDIFSLYNQCFLGLRLTPHDGNANTVQELGLCGIKCCYNGDSKMPNAIPWKHSFDILKTIEKESKTIGKTDTDLSMKMREYLSSDKRWLSSEFYDKRDDFERLRFPSVRFLKK